MAEGECNLSPPFDNFDFDCGRVAKKRVYLTALGTPCQYINIIDEDAFLTPSNSEETELSSDESISSKNSAIQDVSIPPISSSVHDSKEGTLSDPDEVVITAEVVEKKWPLIEFSDSDSEHDKPKSSPCKKVLKPKSSPDKKVLEPISSPDKKVLEPISSPGKKVLETKSHRQKKHSGDSDKEQSKSRYKKHADKDKHKTSQRKYSDDSEDDRSKSRQRRYSDDSEDDRPKSRHRRYPHNSKDSRHKSRQSRYYDDSDEERHISRNREYSRSEDSRRNSKKEEMLKNTKKDEEKKEWKHTPGVTAAFGQYHCQVCDIVVNSEVTYQTHIQGKKHAKALKAKSVPDMVLQSLKAAKVPVQIAPSVVSTVRITKAKRVKQNVASLIQSVADGYKDGPVPGLDEVVEILPSVEGVKDVSYFCKLCESKCVPNTIMSHLTGFKHYLRCIEIVDSFFYDRHKYTPKRHIESKVRQILLDDEKTNGRGKIQVEREVAEEYMQKEPEAGPSWRDTKPPSLPMSDFQGTEDDDVQLVSGAEHLDISMSDFYCRACDAHMNNQSMWETHVRGKRHLKNVKKVPGEITTKIKSVQVTGEEAHLMTILKDLDENDDNDYVIVGLGYIRETQGEAGNLYNCYLCGACTSSFDVVDHLNTTKHKTKYLEEMNSKGFANGIEQIKAITGVSSNAKEGMINEQCRISLQKFGDGKVSVYRSKNLLTSTYVS